MRIGLFSDSYLPATNGVVYVVETMRRHLTEMGHDVFVVAPKPGVKVPRRDKNTLWIPGVGSGIYDDQLTSLFFPSTQLKKIKKLHLEAIVIFTPAQIGMLGAYSATRLKIPLISQYCTDLKEYIEMYPMVFVGFIALGMAGPFMLKLSLTELRDVVRNVTAGRTNMSLTRKQDLAIKLLTVLHDRCDAVVAVSPKMAKELRDWHTTTPVHTIPTGVDPLPVDAEAIRRFKEQHGIVRGDKVCMFVGRLGEEKNLALLVKSFDKIAAKEPLAKLVMVGDYIYRKKLEAMAATSPYANRIIFTGRFPREFLGAAYGAADVFLFPSLTDTQALVLNEAAHAGLPFVWIDDDLNAMLRDGMTGFQAKNDGDDFAAKTIRLLADAKLRQEFGNNSRHEARKFTEVKQTRKMARLLDHLIERHILDQV